jgi:hypothetical protein
MDRRGSGAGIDSFAMRRDSPPNEDAIVVVFWHSPSTSRRTAEVGEPFEIAPTARWAAR